MQSSSDSPRDREPRPGTGTALCALSRATRRCTGLSVWELSVEKSGITAKADGDYQKRTSTPDGSPTSDAEYIEAILRPWPGRRAWAAGKNGDRRWKNIRGYGVDDIEEWLESAPVTHSWVSELLVLAPHGYQAAETWWRGWAGATSPVLPADVVLAGRDNAVTALKSRLGGTPATTTIRGGVRTRYARSSQRSSTGRQARATLGGGRVPRSSTR